MEPIIKAENSEANENRNYYLEIINEILAKKEAIVAKMNKTDWTFEEIKDRAAVGLDNKAGTETIFFDNAPVLIFEKLETVMENDTISANINYRKLF